MTARSGNPKSESSEPRTYLQGYEDGMADCINIWITALDDVGLGYLSFEDAAKSLAQQNLSHP